MSDIITVSSTEELYEALATCQGGETILLEGGAYDDLAINAQSGFDITFPENVTIASADPEDPAVFSTLDVDGAENLTLDGLYFDYTFAEGDESFYRPFEINNSTSITVSNCTFDGDLAEGVSEIDDGYAWAYGLLIGGSSDITLENNLIFEFQNGLVVYETNDIDVIGNEVHSIRTDGMDFVEVNNVLIAENYIHDFAGAPLSDDHSDMIQFWTSGTDSPSTNIVIEDNVLDIGDGTPTQSIFMRNEVVDQGLAGEEMYYQNITISNNVIVNAHTHGITVGETDTLVIENNTVVHDDGIYDDGLDHLVEVPTINVVEDSVNVTISQNVSYAVTGHTGQSDWTVTNNVHVQDQNPADENYYADVFVTSTLDAADGVHAFVAVPGGEIEALGAGANSTRNPEVDSPVDAQFQVEGTGDNAAVRYFDASLTLTNLDSLPEGTTYTWDFGDGTTATGEQVGHAFPDGGVYTVTLTVTLPDGTSDSQSLDIGIESPTVVALTDGAGTVVAYDLGEPLAVAETSSNGVSLSDSGVALTVDGSYLQSIEGADDIEITLTLQADSANNAGEVMRLHSSFIVAVDENGELVVRVFDANGNETKVTTNGAGLDDLDSHDISIHLSGDTLEITVDGEVVGSTDGVSGIGISSSQDLVLGNPWGEENYDGTVMAFEVIANGDDFGEGIEPAPLPPQPEPQPEPEPEPEPTPEPQPEPTPVPEDEPEQEEPEPEPEEDTPVEETASQAPPQPDETGAENFLAKFFAFLTAIFGGDRSTAKDDEDEDIAASTNRMAADENEDQNDDVLAA